jgi:hypothetical protein
MVENVGKAVGISAICHSVPEIKSISDLVSAILIALVGRRRAMSATSPLAVGISAICHYIPEIQYTSGLQSAILTSGSRLTARSVRH